MSRYVVHPAKEQNTDPRYFDRSGQTVSGLGEVHNTGLKIPLWMVVGGAAFWAFGTESGKKIMKKLKAS